MTTRPNPDAVLLAPDGAVPDGLGGKGENLARLVAAGLPVPECGVVTTSAYRQMVDRSPDVANLIDRIRRGAHVPAEQVDAIFENADVPADVAEAICELARAVGPTIAVRSSATVEDLGGSSFAGQYRSILNVDAGSRQDVLDAARAVWASLWHPAPTAYRRAFGVDDADAAMAVVLMRMVDAETAGVVFTRDPGGRDDAATIEAVEGLGDSLVSGELTPDSWVVPRRGDDRPALPARVESALELALEAERHMGVEQDVEWAATSDEVFVVQTRPITVLETHDGFDTDVDDHELTTAGIVETVPGVLPPLRWELNRFLLEESFRCVLDDLGVLASTTEDDRPFVRRVRGRAAIDFDQLRLVASAIPGAVEELEHQYFGDRPTVPADENRTRWQTIRHDLRVLGARRRVIEKAETVIGTADLLYDNRPALDEWSDAKLLAYRLRLTDVAASGLAGELGVAAAGAASYRRLELLIEPHLGADAAARYAQRVTTGAGLDTHRRPSSSAAVFGGPTWNELDRRPPRIRSSNGADAARRELEQALTSSRGWKRRRVMTGQLIDVKLHLVRRTIADAIDQLRRREAAKGAVLELGGEVRRVHLELGRRLVGRGVLSSAVDVEFMTSAEVSEALSGTTKVTREMIGRRRNWVSRFEAEGELPARFVGIPERTPVPLPDGDRLTGWAASPGRYEGVARVCDSPDDTVEPGTILVAAATDASWSPLFVEAGAIVVERGGPLSHAAIVARELGVPAVLNVRGATGVLDGLTVTVDGDAGVVVLEGQEL